MTPGDELLLSTFLTGKSEQTLMLFHHFHWGVQEGGRYYR
jgi:hypothetical protein